MSKRYIEYKIESQSTGTGKPEEIAHVWWDGKRIDSDNAATLAFLKKQHIFRYSFKDGLKFLGALPYLYRNGYTTATRIR